VLNSGPKPIEDGVENIISKIVPGTLDLMVLVILKAKSRQHGFGLAREIEEISNQTFLVNHGTIYQSLIRLRRRKCIVAVWGLSRNNRKARFYSLTKKGREQLSLGRANWVLISHTIDRILQMDR
jgi:PadR family transcriptional regulator PadR